MTLAEPGDVEILPPHRRSFADVSTWAHDRHDEVVGLWCHQCAEVDPFAVGQPLDGDLCRRGHEDTVRVITDADDNILRGPKP